MTENNRQPKNLKGLKIRKWQPSDIEGLVKCYRNVYSNHFETLPADDKRLFEFNLQNFSEGQMLAEFDGEVVGYSCSILVQLDGKHDYYSYAEITGDGSFSSHTPSGDTLYGADIAVIDKFRGRGIAGLFYEERKKILKRYNLRRMVAHGRIPGYSQWAGKLSPDEYVSEVQEGRIKDPALNAHLRAGYIVKKVLLETSKDTQSLNYATWLEYKNPTYNAIKRKIAASPITRPVRRVRVCAAQFEMRVVKNWQEFETNARFFIDSAASYHSHLLVFPELITAQLFSCFDPELSEIDAVNELTNYTEQYIEFFRKEAMSNHLYIVAGSHPTKDEDKIYNTSYLFTPSGNYHTQEKLHITPTERESFRISPGRKIRLFDTSFARIAIVVCYDIEFPELTRLLVQHGAEIIIVPFSTDERKAYNRIRFTASARAVENYTYVVLAGNVGNLHNVKSYLINYAQSAILTPSDFGFPNGSIEAEADPNTETVVLADLDITNLLIQRDTGTVRPFFDKRSDLYSLEARVPIEIIKCQ